MPDKTKEPTKFGNKVFRDVYFLLFNDKRTQDVFKMFCLQNDERLTSQRSVKTFKNLKTHIRKQLCKVYAKQSFTRETVSHKMHVVAW